MLQRQLFEMMKKENTDWLHQYCSGIKDRFWWYGVKIRQSSPCPFHPESLSFVPPMLPPFLLPSSLHAPPLPLPGAPLWRLVAAAAASPAGCSLALPRTQRAPAKHSAASGFRLRGGGEKGEGKHFKLQIQPTKQGRPDVSSSTDTENLNVRWRLLIRFFIAEKIHLSTLSLLSSASTLSLIYFGNSRHVSCW